MNRVELETELGVELPSNFETYDNKTQQQVIEYLKQLDPIEKKAYGIGKQHLGTSFNLIRSNGFTNWSKKL
jgi:hypothetical protein